jgi:hypothetical protein
VQVRITVIADPPGRLVQVDGWLAGAGVAELVRVLDAAGTPARLSLRDLRGADPAGVAVLRRLAEQGASLEGLPMYLQLVLADTNGRGTGSTPPFPAAASETVSIE